MAVHVVQELIRQSLGHGKDLSHYMNARLARLSPREHEVLEQVVRGSTSREIAESLGVKKRTVDHHREHIMRKLEVHSLAQLVVVALQSARHGERHL